MSEKYEQRESKDISTTFLLHTEWAKSDKKGPNPDNRQLQLQFMGYKNILVSIAKQSMSDGKFTEKQTILIPDGGDILGAMVLFTKASTAIKQHISLVATGSEIPSDKVIFAKSHTLRTGNVLEIKSTVTGPRAWKTELFMYRKNKETNDVFLIADFTFPNGSVVGSSADELLLDSISGNIRAMVYGTSSVHAMHVARQSNENNGMSQQKPTAPTSYDTSSQNDMSEYEGWD